MFERKLPASNGGVYVRIGRFSPSEKTSTESRLPPWSDLFSGSARRSLCPRHLSPPLIIPLHGVSPPRNLWRSDSRLAPAPPLPDRSRSGPATLFLESLIPLPDHHNFDVSSDLVGGGPSFARLNPTPFRRILCLARPSSFFRRLNLSSARDSSSFRRLNLSSARSYPPDHRGLPETSDLVAGVLIPVDLKSLSLRRLFPTRILPFFHRLTSSPMRSISIKRSPKQRSLYLRWAPTARNDFSTVVFSSPVNCRRWSVSRYPRVRDETLIVVGQSLSWFLGQRIFSLVLGLTSPVKDLMNLGQFLLKLINMGQFLPSWFLGNRENIWDQLIKRKTKLIHNAGNHSLLWPLVFGFNMPIFKFGSMYEGDNDMTGMFTMDLLFSDSIISSLEERQSFNFLFVERETSSASISHRHGKLSMCLLLRCLVEFQNTMLFMVIPFTRRGDFLYPFTSFILTGTNLPCISLLGSRILPTVVWFRSLLFIDDFGLWIARFSSRPFCDPPFQGMNAHALQAQYWKFKTAWNLLYSLWQWLPWSLAFWKRTALRIYENPSFMVELLISSISISFAVTLKSRFIPRIFNGRAVCLAKKARARNCIFSHVSSSVPDWLSPEESLFFPIT
ncbi:hypothetical protein ISN44_As13g019000 [Arabidopsis suecica]|uniref:Uncharacterized protein n=1 Tax=Arabidopsis suecica TaxID=45249 RepID=A0A8T1XTN2_ARASU|nr:hypothetical protein ISN44_As13g019000 [Arabidopsis suecica]